MEENTIQLDEARERARTVNFLKTIDGWAVKVARGQKMPNSYNHPRNNTAEKAYKTLNNVEFADCNIGIHLHGNLVDVDIDIKDEGLLRYAMPALDAFLPPSNHIWGTEKRPRTHRAYLVRGSEDYEPRDFPVLRRLQKIPEANVEIRGGPKTSGLFSLLPPSVHPTDGYYKWDTSIDPTAGLTVVDTKDLVRAIRMAGGVALLAPHWTEGQRQEMTMALAGFLHRIVTQQEIVGGLPDNDKLFLMTEDDADRFLEVLLSVADEDKADRHMRQKAFSHTWKKANKGGEVTGASRMQELSGDETLVRKLYTLFTDNPELQKYQEFEEQFAIWTGKGSIISMDAINRGDVDSSLMSKDQFFNSFMHKSCVFAGKSVLMASLLYSSKTVQRLNGFEFFPGDNKRIVSEGNMRKVNLWTGFAVEPCDDVVEDDEVKLFTDYVYDIVCSKDRKRYEWVLAWVADILQNPAEKPGTVLVLVGKQGSGKSFLGEGVLGPIIGNNHYVSPTQVNRITSRFNRMFGYKVLIQLDEAMNSNQRAVADFMKGLITGKTFEFEPKGLELVEHTACHRILATSNHERNAVPLDGGEEDRRYTILKVRPDKKRDVEYWEKMHKWFGSEENLAKVHRWLLQHDYDKKLIRYSLNTTEKSETAMSSMTAYDRWLLSMLERNHPLSAKIHQRWWQASNFTKSDKNDQSIDRTSWPEYVHPQTLSEDFKLSQNSLPNNLRESMDASMLIQRMVKDGLIDPEFKSKFTVKEFDERTGTQKTDRYNFRKSPSRVRVRDYLVAAHGEAILDGVNESDESLNADTSEPPNKIEY